MINRSGLLQKMELLWIRVAFMSLFLALVVPSSAWAHRLIIYGWVEGDHVITNSRFSNQRPVKGGDIAVFDSAGNLQTKGKTNEKGEFSFQVPGVGALEITLSAGPGHKANWRMSEAELLAAGSHPYHKKAVSNPLPPARGEIETCNREVVEAVVEDALDRKLRPLMQHIAGAAEKQVSFRDILGGIGYILGLVGLASYMRFRSGNGSKQ